MAEADFAGFRSLSATMALAMALTVGVGEKRRDTSRKRKVFTQFRTENRFTLFLELL